MEVIIMIIFGLVMAVAAVVLGFKLLYKVGRPVAKGTAKVIRRAARSTRIAAS